MSGLSDASICKGDAGAAVVQDDSDVPRLVGLVATGTPGGCLGSSATGHDASVVRVDGLEQWIKSWTLNTSFEPTDPTPFANTPVTATSIANVGPLCCGATTPELGTRAESPHSGTRSLLYSGRDNNTTKSFAYLKAYASPGILVTANMVLSYWIFPQSGGTSGATAKNSTCVAVDLRFSDGTHLRDLKVETKDYRYQHHPAQQCGQLPVNQWTRELVDIGRLANGKTITQVNVGYDQPANTGGYRGYIDDISFTYGCVAVAGQFCAF
jgi:hypothetical protein